MMKILVVVGTNAPFSYNRFLAKFITEHYAEKANFELAEIADLPLFNRESQGDKNVQTWRNKIKDADGVILTIPEYDHSIPAALKSSLEWLGAHAGPNLMKMKPVAVLGGAYGKLGGSRAQEEIREVLLSPDMTANVLPGNEVLIGNINRKIDKKTNRITDNKVLKQVDNVVNNFIAFVDQNLK